MKTRSAILALTALCLGSAFLQAQAVRSGEDVLGRVLFPPEFVLQHARAIGLQAEQRARIVSLMKEAQGDFLDLKLEMSERTTQLLQELQTAGAAPTVNEREVLALVDSVLAHERAMKRRQMVLLIRVKNALTKQQQDQLQELRKQDDVAVEEEARKLRELRRLEELRKSGKPEP